MENNFKIPFYAKAALVFIGTYAFIYMLIIAQDILIPIVYALLIAILLNPLVNFLTRHKINRIVSIFIALLLTIVVTFSIVWFISSQLTQFKEALPKFEVKLNELLGQIIEWTSGKFNVSQEKISAAIVKGKSELLSNSGTYIGQTLNTISGILIIVVLLPVYIFFILFYKPLLLEFIRKLFQQEQHKTVVEVLVESKGLVQSYLAGLLIEAGIVAALNSTGLLILGIDYAILLGTIGAILNIIPYLGGIVAVALPMLVALVNKSPTEMLLVFGVYMLVQFIDNNFLVPRIVASKVKLNALVSIVIVIAGGAIWGLSGMFLSIPVMAILKVIFDRIEPLKPWGYLLGDHMPDSSKLNFTILKPKKKNKSGQ
ncbi:MAG: AI-2E family transporter [Bacteroidota bacterium]